MASIIDGLCQVVTGNKDQRGSLYFGDWARNAYIRATCKGDADATVMVAFLFSEGNKEEEQLEKYTREHFHQLSERDFSASEWTLLRRYAQVNTGPSAVDLDKLAELVIAKQAAKAAEAAKPSYEDLEKELAALKAAAKV